MNREELTNLVSLGESETLEFKQATTSKALQELGKSLCGFLNHKGGIGLFGVTDNKKIIGQEVSDGTKREITENLLKCFQPHAPINVEYIEVGEGKWVIALKTNDEEADPPYYFNKIPYYRSLAGTKIMSPSRLEALLEEKKWRAKSWELLPAIGMTMEDLDNQEISNTIMDGIRKKRIPANIDPKDMNQALMGLDLIDDDGQINNAAIVLFVKKPTSKYTQLLLRLARFRGKDKKEFIDNQRVYGNAFKILKAFDDFCDRHLPILSRFEDGRMDRIDEPFLPPKAIREAVINAIIHRDYTIYGSAINVAIYDDRIVVESYGTLPKKITLDKLKTNHKSYPRNPVIADVFYNRGFIEQWGRGTQLIVEYCLAAGHPEPEFIEDAGGLTVCMYSKYPMQTQIDLVPEIHVQLEPRELKIFEILTTHLGGLSSGELTEVLQDSLGKRTVLRDLRNLEDKGLVCRKGKGNKIIWVKV